MKNIQKITWGSLLLFSMLLVVSACRKSNLVYSVANKPNITHYLMEHPDQFSELSKVLQLSETASFLDAYGSYTFFAPDNAAMKAYLQSQGKSNVEEISGQDWKNFVRFHLLEDSLSTEQFTDGKLPELTMFGQYLITGSESMNGITKISVNRQANISVANISVGNGLIHAIDHVLTPATLTVAQTIEADTRFSIFTEALKATGLYETLNILPADNEDESQKFLTVIAESDEVLQAAGINSLDDLKNKYSDTGDPMLATDSLNLFMKYHILNEAKYLADIITATAHNTLAPLEVLTAKLSGETVLINDDYFNGVHEPGIVLPRTEGDISATNGVVHHASTHFGIKLRTPYRVDFDVCTFPEMLKNKAHYGVANYFFTTEEAGNLSEIKFSGKMENERFIYRYGSGQGTSKYSYNQDCLVIPLATGGTSSRPAWVDFKTPMLIRGKYKVWVAYYTQRESSSNGGTFLEAQALIGAEDSEERTLLANARVLNFVTKRPGQPSDVEEAIGYKTYMENTSGSVVARLMGIADIEQTGRYWLRLQAVNGSQRTNNIDLIQFIPVGDDQQYPKFKTDGTLIPRP